MNTKHLERFTDAQLLETTHSLVARERTATAELIAVFSEVDARRLYLGLGYSSMFAFCTLRLRLSESAAYARIEAARIAVRFPIVLELLLDGAVNLTTVSLLAPHLTEENHAAVLRAAIHKSKRDVELQIAALRPTPAVPTVVRKLPQSRALTEVGQAKEGQSPRSPVAPGADPPLCAPAAHPVEPAPAAHLPKPARVAPLSPERYKMQVTISRETHDKLRRAQNLLRHSVPDGDVALILDRALTLLVEQLEKQKCGSGTPRTTQRHPNTDRSRHVPASVKREVWARDGGQCAFVGTDGRCPERAWLEFHHVVPYADGGETNASNLQLRCSAHNRYEGELMFGPWKARELSIGYSSHSTGSGPS